MKTSASRTWDQRLGLLNLLILLSIPPLLASCGSIGASVAATAVKAAVGGGGGPSLDAQIGQNNTRTVQLGYSESITGDKVVKNVEAQRVDKVINQDIPPWVLLLLVLGWLLPSPGEIARWIRGLFKRG